MHSRLYSDRGPRRSRWPLSRVARYLFSFVLGTLTGAGLAASFTEPRAASLGEAATDPSARQSAATAFRRPAVERDSEEAIRGVIRAELEGIEGRIDAIEASLATIARPAHAPKDEDRFGATNSHGPSELDSAAVNRSYAVELVQEGVVPESTLPASIENKVVSALDHGMP